MNILVIIPIIFFFILNFSNAFADAGHTHEVSADNLIYNEMLATDTNVNIDLFSEANNDKSSHIGGFWSKTHQNWDILAVHATLLPNGKILAWDATPDDFDGDPHSNAFYTTRVTIWQPPQIFNTEGRHTRTDNNTGTDLFCAGSAHLWDGRVVFTGGDTGIQSQGVNAPSNNANIYDYTLNSWDRLNDMFASRWYSSVTVLSTGRLLTFGGTYNPTPYAELLGLDKLWQGLNILPPYETTTGDYQWMLTADVNNEDDVVYVFGPHSDILKVDTKNGGQLDWITKRDEEYRSYGSFAMFDAVQGHVLVAGGGRVESPDLSFNSSLVIKLKESQVENVGNLNIRRRQHNMTILADQSVLATGGHQGADSLINLDPSYQANFAEIWSPETKQWTVLNESTTARQYHSIAILLPDASVLVAGGGYCGSCDYLGYYEQNAEIFYPPYLFDEGSNTPTTDRPLIQSPNINQINKNQHYTVNYDQDFTVTTNQTDRIRKITLIKLGSVTHSTNQEQRGMQLEFRKENNQLVVRSPHNRRIAPPGHYMLFIINEKGIPSVSEIIKVGTPLLQTNEAVNDRLHKNKTNYYKINMKENRGLIVSNNNPLVTVRAFVGDFPTEALNSCEYLNTINCEVNTTPGQDIYISATADLNDGEALDYTLTTVLTADVPTKPNNDNVEQENIIREVNQQEINQYINKIFQYMGRWFLITPENDNDRHCLLVDSNLRGLRTELSEKPPGIHINWLNNFCSNDDIALSENQENSNSQTPDNKQPVINNNLNTSIGSIFEYDDRWFLVTEISDSDTDQHCLLADSELAGQRNQLDSKPSELTINWKNNICSQAHIDQTNEPPPPPVVQINLDAFIGSIFKEEERWFLITKLSDNDSDYHCLLADSELAGQRPQLSSKPNRLTIHWEKNICSQAHLEQINEINTQETIQPDMTSPIEVMPEENLPAESLQDDNHEQQIGSVFEFEGRWFLITQKEVDTNWHCLLDTTDLTAGRSRLNSVPTYINIQWRSNTCSTELLDNTPITNN